MHKFLYHLLLFTFLPGLLFTYIEISSRCSNSYQIRANYIKENKDSIEIAIFGASHNWRGINPEYLSQNTVSLALAGSGMNIDFLLFDKYLQDFPNLKLVIFGLGGISLENFREKDWKKNHLLHIFFGINNYKDSPPLKDYFLLTANFKLHLKRFLTDKSQLNQHGFMIKSKKGDEPVANLYSKIQINKIANKKNSLPAYKYNSSNLEKRIKWCLENNIKVLMISNPKLRPYNENIKQSKIKRRDKFVEQYQNIEDVYFRNYAEIYEDRPELFRDFHHLNPRGAKKYTLMLDSLIQSIL